MSRDDNVCPTCNGRGHLRIRGEWVQCPTCSGSFIVIAEDKKIEGKVEGTSASDVAEVINAIINHGKDSGVKIMVSNSNIGVITTGDMKNVRSISTSIDTLVKCGDFEVAQALNKLSNAIATTQEISSSQRSELLDLLQEIAKEAGRKPEERSSTAAIKAIFSSLARGIGMAGGLAEVWSTWGAVISRFFGF